MTFLTRALQELVSPDSVWVSRANAWVKAFRLDYAFQLRGFVSDVSRSNHTSRGMGGFSLAIEPGLLADRELVVRAQAGDPHAIDDLLTAVQPAILKFCHYRLSTYGGGRDAADDAAQETCLAVAHVLGSYQDQGLPFRSWVYAIAANKVADSQRTFSRSAVLVDELPDQVEPSPTPEELAVAAAQYRAAMALTERLPARMRDVLLLRVSGMTAKRVGELLGMTAGAVNVAHHRAVGRLRELADESEELRELFAALRTPDSTGQLPQVA